GQSRGNSPSSSAMIFSLFGYGTGRAPYSQDTRPVSVTRWEACLPLATYPCQGSSFPQITLSGHRTHITGGLRGSFVHGDHQQVIVLVERSRERRRRILFEHDVVRSDTPLVARLSVGTGDGELHSVLTVDRNVTDGAAIDEREEQVARRFFSTVAGV